MSCNNHGITHERILASPHVTRYLERTGAGVTLLRPWDSRTPDTGHCFLLLSRVETDFYMGTGAQIQIGNPRQAKTKGRGWTCLSSSYSHRAPVKKCFKSEDATCGKVKTSTTIATELQMWWGSHWWHGDLQDLMVHLINCPCDGSDRGDGEWGRLSAHFDSRHSASPPPAETRQFSCL